MYGITFPDAASMKDYQHRMEQAKERDHRNIGTQQELFFFDRMSPGSCFFMPHGTRIYNTLVEVRHERGLAREGWRRHSELVHLLRAVGGFLLWKRMAQCVMHQSVVIPCAVSRRQRQSAGDHSRNELAFCAQINSLE